MLSREEAVGQAVNPHQHSSAPSCSFPLSFFTSHSLYFSLTLSFHLSSLSLSLSPSVSLLYSLSLSHSLSPLQIGYWEVYDGAAIRELEGSQSGAINGMHVSQDGCYFITGMKRTAPADVVKLIKI